MTTKKTQSITTKASKLVRKWLGASGSIVGIGGGIIDRDACLGNARLRQ